MHVSNKMDKELECLGAACLTLRRVAKDSLRSCDFGDHAVAVVRSLAIASGVVVGSHVGNIDIMPAGSFWVVSSHIVCPSGHIREVGSVEEREHLSPRCQREALFRDIRDDPVPVPAPSVGVAGRYKIRRARRAVKERRFFIERAAILAPKRRGGCGVIRTGRRRAWPMKPHTSPKPTSGPRRSSLPDHNFKVARQPTNLRNEVLALSKPSQLLAQRETGYQQ